MECKWLPEFYDAPDWNDLVSFENKLYKFFTNLYYGTDMFFKEKKVTLRTFKIMDGKEEAYYHLTHEDYYYTGFEDRILNESRVMRIKWPIAIINNYNCSDTCCEDKPKVWSKIFPKNNKLRYKILFRGYFIVLEDYTEYFELVTAYPVENYREKALIREYKKCI